MAEYLNYDHLCDVLNKNVVSRHNRGDSLTMTYGYHECVCDVEDPEQWDVIDIVRCGECDMQKMCRYAPHLGEDGYCSRGMRKEEITSVESNL